MLASMLLGSKEMQEVKKNTVDAMRVVKKNSKRDDKEMAVKRPAMTILKDTMDKAEVILGKEGRKLPPPFDAGFPAEGTLK